MANKIYPKFKEACLKGDIDLDTATVKCVLVDSADYTYSDTHDFYDDITLAGRVGTPQTIGSITTTNGEIDGADVTFPAVTGDQSEAIVLFIDTGTESTSHLICYLDTGITGLPVTPSGADIAIAWGTYIAKL